MKNTLFGDSHIYSMETAIKTAKDKINIPTNFCLKGHSGLIIRNWGYFANEIKQTDVLIVAAGGYDVSPHSKHPKRPVFSVEDTFMEIIKLAEIAKTFKIEVFVMAILPRPNSKGTTDVINRKLLSYFCNNYIGISSSLKMREENFADDPHDNLDCPCQKVD